MDRHTEEILAKLLFVAGGDSCLVTRALARHTLLEDIVDYIEAGRVN